MKTIFKRIVSYAIIFALIMVSTPNQQITNYGATNDNNVKVLTHENGNIEATQVIDGTEVKTIYDKEQDQYTLYREDATYNLKVYEYDGEYVAQIADLDSDVDVTKVTGQFAMALPLVYWSAPFLAAAMATIKAVVVTTAGVVVTWYLADSIAKTISNTKANTSVKPKNQPVVGYYMAKIIGGGVAIGLPINYLQAVATVKVGLDIFATTSSAAKNVAMQAGTTLGLPTHHNPHGGDGYYPHWHPVGVKWAYNRSHAPHCWYGPVK